MKVCLEDVPAGLLVEHVEHLENLVRELRVVASGQASGIAPLAGEITSVVAEVLGRYARVRDETYLRAREALAHGEERIAVEIELPAEAADHAEQLLQVLEEADDLCRREDLLTLPASPDVAHFRRWAMSEVVRQLQSGEPGPNGAAGR